MVHKAELTNKKYSLKCRLRLFDSVVTPTVLYGCSSWTFSVAMNQKLQTTQRRMLRMILGVGRRRTKRVCEVDADENDHSGSTSTSSSSSSSSRASCSSSSPPNNGSEQSSSISNTIEPWIDWIKRATAQVEHHMAELNMDSWGITWRRNIWRYAARLAGMPKDRWAVKATTWNAEDCRRARGRRPHGPNKRWNHEILQFLLNAGYDVDGTNWLHVATNHKWWKDMEKEFCCYR